MGLCRRKGFIKGSGSVGVEAIANKSEAVELAQHLSGVAAKSCPGQCEYAFALEARLSKLIVLI
ncbi:hypothetical protein C8255_09750 [filamentous cyanobacterium CCP3]|nr:hypothetical protein C8255_09750 [filamentous cyanobacterium CCP3]